jgi:hypothetical protein
MSSSVTDKYIGPTVTDALTHIDKYDNGIITRVQMAEQVRNLITIAINATWDAAFKCGVENAQVDEAEDDDDDYEDEYELDLDDEEFPDNDSEENNGN